LKPPTVSISGETVGGERGGCGKTARSECGLCLWGKLGFILISVKIISRTLLMTKNDVKTLSLKTYCGIVYF
jgi:hypothetical protein